MSHLNRVCVAAAVAVLQGRKDQGHKWKSGLNSFRLSKRRFFSGGDKPDFRPLYGAIGLDLTGIMEIRDGYERQGQTEESLQRVMYLNCWGQS
ncbi:hypothetical protein HS088_TW06G00168 [Tripterygium wilfordii]|uniref:Uncharacterized protein n=1 Tax=Tripterygium wilfordii TaxID=458696 RepID=A0A7J7DI72_TRIWF|nr:uncharacterized protein LOC120000934 [Tripterygium wilfordii]KAF5746003.1 hypothetical protein HS088_TW06G00168 [Tripterygium wilfordii]